MSTNIWPCLPAPLSLSETLMGSGRNSCICWESRPYIPSVQGSILFFQKETLWDLENFFPLSQAKLVSNPDRFMSSVWPQTSHLPSPSFSFLLSKVGNCNVCFNGFLQSVKCQKHLTYSKCSINISPVIPNSLVFSQHVVIFLCNMKILPKRATEFRILRICHGNLTLQLLHKPANISRPILMLAIFQANAPV